MEVMRAFTHFPRITFIWKLSADDPDRDLLDGVANVHAVVWLPQIALLSERVNMKRV